MKIIFDNPKNYIEIIKKSEKISLIISAADSTNSSKSIVNSVNLTMEQFKNLVEALEKS